MSSERVQTVASGHSADGIMVRVDNLSKCYHIFPGNRARLRQAFFPKKKYYEEFWALKDINFEIRRGEAIGIIGLNGAGKSTLLQLLAGILRPTSGVAEVRGRISALIELGAGFDPQYTGRENAYMNGAIMGLSRKYVDGKIKEIRDFADIGDFFDRPIWMYSSGMYMRLAFAVATTLEPEILIVDEVLAVGDINFQTKCLNKMAELRKVGVTTVFVSHNMDTVRYFCKKGLALDKGKIVAFGPVEEAIDVYVTEILEAASGTEAQESAEVVHEGEIIEHGDSWIARISRFEMLDHDEKPAESFKTGDTVIFRIHYEAREPLREPSFAVGLYDQRDELVCVHTTAGDQVPIEKIEGTGYIDMVVQNLPLLTTVCNISVSITDKEQIARYDWHSKSYTLKIEGGEGTRGKVSLPHYWSGSALKKE